MSVVLKTLLVVLALYLAGFVLFAETLPAAPAKLGKPDAIVALTGGGARLDTAVALFESGVGKRLLISGVDPAATRAQIKTLAHGAGRFDCCADLGFAAVDTHGNAQETADWVRTHRYRSLVVVTARYHMPRSLSEFSARMPGVALEPYPVDPEGIDLQQWWRDPRALRLLQVEYAKYLASVTLTHVFPDRDALDRGASQGNASRAS
ncbi:MAG TPA: YdcF family protein [Rhizomicrobium sp.]|nr:YdcF family protein [Rhizomicrobium sp.]